MTNLQTFINSNQCMHFRHDCRELIVHISTICATIAQCVAKGSLNKHLGAKTGTQNIQDEEQKMLDVVANDIFIQKLTASNLVAGLASEELAMPSQVPYPHQKGELLVAFDPLDGSSNIDIHMPVGSIFSILDAPSSLKNNTRNCTEQDFLQSGNAQLASGYALYSASCLFVFSLGNGTHGFTLDPQSGNFMLTHANMHIPQETNEYAINTTNYRHWPHAMRRYVRACNAGTNGVRGRNFNTRWVGTMVADIHRILCRGGVYLYPKDTKVPQKDGRLRLLYETNPMGMLVEQANGRASTCNEPMLEVIPQSLHQRIGVAMGSTQEVTYIENLYKQYGNV